jgi:hypothetical protein
MTDTPRRVAQLTLLLSSDQPGEVAAAAHAMNRALDGAGLSWHDVAEVVRIGLSEVLRARGTSTSGGSRSSAPATSPAAPRAPCDDWIGDFIFCSNNWDRLVGREADLMTSLQRLRQQGRHPSEAQLRWLQAIVVKVQRRIVEGV